MTPDLRKRVIGEMKAVFGDDQGRIDHAMRVLGFAEQILAGEQEVTPRGGSPDFAKATSDRPDPPGHDVTVVTTAAILHDIGIPAAEATHGSSAARYQEIEGPPIARKILERLDVDAATIDTVCTIIAHHHNGQIDTPEFNIIWDADWLVNFPGHYADADAAKRSAAIDKLFRTSTGRKLAEVEHLSQLGE